MKTRVITMGLLAAGACSPGGDPRPDPVAPVCLIAPADSPTVRDTVVIVADDPGVAAQLRFAQVVARLVRLDCGGMPVPERAGAWEGHDGGRTWQFTMVPGSSTADQVVEQWNARRNGGLWPWHRILAVEAPDPLHLEVQLDSAFTTLPDAFTLSPLALVATLPPTPLARGTGPYALILEARPQSGPVASVAFLAPARRDILGPLLALTVLRPGTDPRDALDFPASGFVRPADILVTRDRLTLEYARGRRDFSVHPLAWSRRYLLVQPGAQDRLSLPTGEWRPFASDLADQVVETVARPAGSGDWAAVCPRPAAASGGAPGNVYYESGDRVARSLAERLAALAMGGRTPWLDALLRNGTGVTVYAIGLSGDSLQARLATGLPGSYVVSQPRDPGPACTVARWPSPAAVVPLVETRNHAVIREGTPAVLVDGVGTLRVLTGSPYNH